MDGRIPLLEWAASPLKRQLPVPEGALWGAVMID